MQFKARPHVGALPPLIVFIKNVFPPVCQYCFCISASLLMVIQNHVSYLICKQLPNLRENIFSPLLTISGSHQKLQYFSIMQRPRILTSFPTSQQR